MKKNSVSFPYLEIALCAVFLYVGIAWAAFQWRNPTSNQMSFYRDFWSVITWEQMDKYQ
jgi:hypothetical protein